ncbi:MAG: oligopeptide transporter, OPT family [Gammaproteobacteria bacterium]
MSTQPPRFAQPLGADSTQVTEITFKAIVLSILLAIVLGAANAYLALKVGKTVAASIPAAVISMGIFRFFRSSSILETNLVQTAASAGEGLASAAAFVMPALIMIGYWQSFNFWQSALLMLLGGTLGVLFSVPLRRVLLGLKTLTFPEGTAIGTVMKASASKAGNMKRLIQGGVIGGIIELFQSGFNIAADHLPLWIKSGNTLMGISLGFNPALIGAGYIVGIQAGMAMLLGTLIGWVIGVPILSWVYGVPAVSGNENMVMTLWNHYIRYIGVGTMLIAGIWTIFTLIKPMVKGMQLAMDTMKTKRNQGAGTIPRTETDMRMSYVLWGFGLCLLALLFLIVFLIQGLGLTLSSGLVWSIAFISIAYIVALGFISSLLAGYLVGLIGSTNTPISGLMIINVLLLSLLLIPLFGLQVNFSVVWHQKSVLAIVIFVLSVVGFATVITNENIQDLKAGQMVGATPWKQQVMMLVGVFASSFVIGPVLELLFKAYGMGGIFPHPGMNAAQMLPAPQAGLIAAIANGALGHNLPWKLLISGVGIGIVCIFIDEYCKTKNLRLPVLAVGLGIYLPPDLITPVAIGGLASYLVSRTREKRQAVKTAQAEKSDEAQQHGLLAACGLVAGSSLMGVLLAIPFVIAGSSSILQLVSSRFAPWGNLIGAVIIFAVCVWLYRVAVNKQKAY